MGEDLGRPLLSEATVVVLLQRRQHLGQAAEHAQAAVADAIQLQPRAARRLVEDRVHAAQAAVQGLPPASIYKRRRTRTKDLDLVTWA